jgi:putative transposase
LKLYINQLIKWTGVPDDPETDRVERIIFIDETGTDIATINVDRKSAKPIWRKYTDFEAALHEAEACILEIDHRAPASLTANDLNQPKNRKIKKVRDKRWEVIASLVSGDNAIKMLFLHERAALIAERTSVKFAHGKGNTEITYSRKSIYTFVRLWWQGGQVKNALLGRYVNCGASGKERVQKEKKLGRPSKISVKEHTTGTVLTPYWLNIIYLGALLFFNNQKIKDFQAAYRHTLRHFCPKGKIQNEKGEWEVVIPDYTKGEVFSPIQFKYHVLKRIDRHLQEFFRKKFGERRYNLRYRGLKGTSTSEAPYPGAIYQIDATIADIYLVSRLNRTHIIGRPVITVIIDVFSRMIVGVCVRMEREGWNVINLALKNAAEDKVGFCEKYGIEITESDWPVIGLCDALVGDRGPMIGYNADNLTAGLGVSVSNLPPFRADWKGIVEQMFHLMNIRVIRQLPGALNPEKERGDRDVRLDAVLDIGQFTTIVIKAILYHNNYHHMSSYPMDKDMIAAGVKPIPRQLLLWGRENRSGRPKYKGTEEIRIHLLPGGEATVTSRGIRFKGEFYTCRLAEEENWRFVARNRGAWKVTIAYDPRLPGIIYLRLNGTQSIPCHLMN